MASINLETVREELKSVFKAYNEAGAEMDAFSDDLSLLLKYGTDIKTKLFNGTKSEN